jgi:long-chain fatty acid transport protein
MKILFLLTLLISKANAGGAFLYEVGIPDNGWAAAGRAAYDMDSSTVYGNPAGLSYLEKSEFVVGVQPKFVMLGFDNSSMDNDINLSMHVPGASFFYNTKFGDKVGFGIGVLSFMGLAIDYGDYWEGKNWIQESALLTMDLVPAFSYEFSDKFSLGLGFDILWGKIDQQLGIGGPTSSGQISYEDG